MFAVSMVHPTDGNRCRCACGHKAGRKFEQFDSTYVEDEPRASDVEACNAGDQCGWITLVSRCMVLAG